MCNFIFLVIGQQQSLLYHSCGTEGILESLSNLIMDVLSKDILACSCKAVTLQERRVNCSTLVLLWVLSAKIRSWVKVSSFPRFLWYHFNYIRNESQRDKDRIQKDLFSIVFPWHARTLLWSPALCLLRSRTHRHFNKYNKIKTNKQKNHILTQKNPTTVVICIIFLSIHQNRMSLE